MLYNIIQADFIGLQSENIKIDDIECVIKLVCDIKVDVIQNDHIKSDVILTKMTLFSMLLKYVQYKFV